MLQRPQVAKVTKPRRERSRTDLQGRTRPPRTAAGRWPSCDPSSTFTTTNSRNFTRSEVEEQRRRGLPFLKLKPLQPSCHRPPASSRSPDPTAHLCCPALRPPRSPGAPAAAPSPSLLLLTLKQHQEPSTGLNINVKLCRPPHHAGFMPVLCEYYWPFYYEKKQKAPYIKQQNVTSRGAGGPLPSGDGRLSFLSRTSCSISFFRSSWSMAVESKASLTNSDTPGLVDMSSSSSRCGWGDTDSVGTPARNHGGKHPKHLQLLTFWISVMDTGGVLGRTLST